MLADRSQSCFRTNPLGLVRLVHPQKERTGGGKSSRRMGSESPGQPGTEIRAHLLVGVLQSAPPVLW